MFILYIAVTPFYHSNSVDLHLLNIQKQIISINIFTQSSLLKLNPCGHFLFTARAGDL